MIIEGWTIKHFGDTDTLVLYIDGATGEGETIAPYLWALYGLDGEVKEIVIDRAYRTFAPYLFPDAGQEGKRKGHSRDMAIAYAPETDTLRLQTGEPPYAGYTEKTVAPGLRVNFDPEGWAMGVVIEGAAELLRPHLLPGGERKSAAAAERPNG